MSACFANSSTPRRWMITAVGAAIGGLLVAAPANADALSNGYNATCTPSGSNVSCSISGCPRVHQDQAGDIINVRVNGGPQSEIRKACNSSASVSGPNGTTGFTLAVQGCRTQSLGPSHCGAWSDYRYTPPVGSNPAQQPSRPQVPTGPPFPLRPASPASPPVAPPGASPAPQPSAPPAPSPSSRPNPDAPNHRMS